MANQDFVPGDYHFIVFNSNDQTRLKEVERYGSYCRTEDDVYKTAYRLIENAQKAGLADAYSFCTVSRHIYTINKWPARQD